MHAFPAIHTPIPPAIHPAAERVNAHTARWAGEWDLGEPEHRSHLVRQDLGGFAARILPGGAEPVLEILADFVLWLFTVDDNWCEQGVTSRRPGELAGMLSRLLRAAQAPETPILRTDPLAATLRDLRRRLDRTGSPEQVARWVDALREYCLAVVWEAQHRRSETVPELDDYVLMRLYNGATSPIYPLLEIGNGYELAARERSHPQVRTATEMASFVICWDNDLYSLARENTGRVLNAPTVTAQHARVPLEQAIAETIGQRNEVLTRFLELRDELDHEASPRLRRYLRDLATFIRAAQDWTLGSARYAGSVPAITAPLRDTPAASTGRPIGIPALAGWWETERCPAEPAC